MTPTQHRLDEINRRFFAGHLDSSFEWAEGVARELISDIGMNDSERWSKLTGRINKHYRLLRAQDIAFLAAFAMEAARI